MLGPPQVGVESAHPPSWLAAPQESALELSSGGPCTQAMQI